MNEQKIDCQERIQQSHDYISEFVSTTYGYSPSEAPPKSILKLMNVDGLTIFHVKSHLQKFRNAAFPHGSAKGKSEKRTTSNVESQLDVETGLHIKKAIQLELDVQQHLHEQLEIQRNLQLRIEEQGKQLKNISELQIDLQLKNSDTTFYEGAPLSSLDDEFIGLSINT
ncbi:myb family transcription factor PHL5-like [Pyrus x bretschneideri]|uniref:myb family transcription factor PHL5-like n=1 Tax=Pyrus x bretschneideri TaxID=225117 RepID=UPI00203036FD|nr:myb family transcription factor PHL5-like [Pyrus x bretschneideri]